MSRESVIWQESPYMIVRRKPSLLHLIPTKLRQGGLHEKLRWLVQYVYGYCVYVLIEYADEREREREREREAEIGYCFIGDGANFRYTFSKHGDTLVGPYYVVPEKRGEGLAAKLVDICLKTDPPKTGKAWEFIQHNNIASIKTAKKVGFEYNSECRYSKYLRILSSVGDMVGDEKLFCYREGTKDA